MSFIAENQRLIVLRALAGEHDGRMNETLLARELDVFGHRLTQAQVRDVLADLEERDAVRTTLAGGVVMVAEITRRGADHVERRGAPIAGVSVPTRR